MVSCQLADELALVCAVSGFHMASILRGHVKQHVIWIAN
jgi:hypothetical protein